MKFEIRYSIERIEVVEVDNFNEASELAKEGKREGEVIVSIRSR